MAEFSALFIRGGDRKFHIAKKKVRFECCKMSPFFSSVQGIRRYTGGFSNAAGHLAWKMQNEENSFRSKSTSLHGIFTEWHRTDVEWNKMVKSIEWEHDTSGKYLNFYFLLLFLFTLQFFLQFSAVISGWTFIKIFLNRYDECVKNLKNAYIFSDSANAQI